MGTGAAFLGDPSSSTGSMSYFSVFLHCVTVRVSDILGILSLFFLSFCPSVGHGFSGRDCGCGKKRRCDTQDRSGTK